MLTLYSLITIYITSRVIAYLLDGASYDKLLFIISDQHDELKRFIIEDLDRSATYLKARGMYTDQVRDMIFLVVSRKEVHLVQHQIREIDPRAFVVVTDAYRDLRRGLQSSSPTRTRSRPNSVLRNGFGLVGPQGRGCVPGWRGVRLGAAPVRRATGNGIRNNDLK